MLDAELIKVEVGRQIIAYRDVGTGPPLVLLHGFLCDSRCWKPRLSRLSDRFRVVVWDAPGAGSSTDPPETFTTESYVRCLAEFLDAVGIERPHLLGLSWGEILAQEFYRRHPSQPRSLVLADTYAGWKGSLSEAAWRERLATCLKDSSAPASALIDKFVPGVFSDAAPRSLRDEFSTIVAEFHPVGFRLMSRSSAETDMRELLSHIAVPTLLIWGDDDRRSPRHIANQFHAAIPRAELAIIPGAGHLSNVEQPAVFSDLVSRFCGSA